MEHVSKIENRVASWYKKAPNLPVGLQRWLADNIWWLVLIGVIIGAIGVVSIISVTFLAGALLVGFGGAIGATIAGLALIVVLVTLGLSIVNLVIAALAISPLKNKRKKGWSLLFLTMLISVLSLIIGFLLTFELFSFVWGLLYAAVGGYFLFQIRHYFGAASAANSRIKLSTKNASPADKTK
ncbi:MAG TPA: hypothetical protein VFM68_02325 [Candidatus Saccharimonadales bacterium]|nr:hypothetical protein [Candidatus Saccharimonadales bacterium]